MALERKTLVERRAIAFWTRYGDSDLPFAVIGGVYDFRDPKTTPEVLKVAREVEAETDQRIVLVLIDTISRALCGVMKTLPKTWE